MRSATRMVFGLAVLLAGAPRAPAQEIRKEKPYYLRRDEQLQAALNVEADHPKLSHIIVRLREATGLDIEVSSGLAHHDPDFGHVQPSKKGYRAWQLMEMIARRDLQIGHWEKTPGGYRLVGMSVAPVVQPLPDDGHLLGWLLAVCFGLLGFLFVLVRKGKRTIQAAQNPQSQGRSLCGEPPVNR